MKRFSIHLFFLIFILSCTNDKETANKYKEVNVYSHRHYDIDRELYSEFTKQTGIKVNLIKAEADELIVRMEAEGKNCPADLLFTVDAARLYLAKEKGLLQAIKSKELELNIPNNLRDAENYWFGQTIRSRVIVYRKDEIQQSQLPNYEDLANPKWKGKILVRPANSTYNQSLVASLVYHLGEEKSLEWCRGLVDNFARQPKGNDRDQVKALVNNEGDLAIVNTYYIGKLVESDEISERQLASKIAIHFPNQNTTGAHINISGGGVARYAPNKDNAIALLEFLSRKESQYKFALANHEYPVNPEIEYSPLLQSWGEFNGDTINPEVLGKLNKKAVEIMQKAGWQ